MSLVAAVQRQARRIAPCCGRMFSSFRASDLDIKVTDRPVTQPDTSKLTFGTDFTEHMLEIDYSDDRGWERPQIKPLAPFNIHPAAKVFHYATELFEGLKAYRCVDGKVRMFRPMENMLRMHKTAIRGCLPSFDETEMLKCIKRLIQLDEKWVPHEEGYTLYIRPSAIATEPTLGINRSSMAKIFVILSPVGPYFPTGLKPVSLLADPQYVRAWPGGCGNFKLGSNYAPTIQIQATALREKNCQQVLWLFGDDHQMTEVGTMNLFVYWINEQGEEELLTPSLDSGLILPGITRKSLVELTREWNEFKVSERNINMKQFVKALNEGRVKEVFGSGTACVVSPVNKIIYQDQDLHIPENPDNLSQRLYDTLLDIQYYRTPHRWMETLDV